MKRKKPSEGQSLPVGTGTPDVAEKLVLTCLRCGAQMVNVRCKLRCERCGYFASCSDFDMLR